jgi:hypothetical protein
MRRRFSVRQTTPRRRTSCLNTMTELEPAVIVDLAEAGFEYAKHGTKSERYLASREPCFGPRTWARAALRLEESWGSRKGAVERFETPLAGRIRCS